SVSSPRAASRSVPNHSPGWGTLTARTYPARNERTQRTGHESAGEPHEFAAAREKEHAAVVATSPVAQLPLDGIEYLLRGGPVTTTQHTGLDGKYRIGQRGVDLTGADTTDGDVSPRRLLADDLRVRGDHRLRHAARGKQ